MYICTYVQKILYTKSIDAPFARNSAQQMKCANNVGILGSCEILLLALCKRKKKKETRNKKQKRKSKTL